MDRRSWRAEAPTSLRRSYSTSFEVRGTTGNGVELHGYASTTERPYEMNDIFGSYSEVIRAGAFTATLATRPDVALLVNHGGLAMARTAAGSLQLAEDNHGLRMTAQVNTERQDVSDLLKAIEDGTIDQMSFAFRVEDQTWDPTYSRREITAVNLDRGDVSAVNFGANPSTRVTVARSVNPVALQMRMRLGAT